MGKDSSLLLQPCAVSCLLKCPGLQWSLESGGSELSVPPASRYSSLDPDGQLGDGPGSPQFSSAHLLRHFAPILYSESRACWSVVSQVCGRCIHYQGVANV